MSGPQSSSCRQTPESAFCTSRRPIFNAPEGAGGGCCVPGAPENASRTTGGLFAHTNICSVPEKGVSGTEYHSRTREACFLHREPLKMHRVPQEPVFCTARIFRTTGGLLRYRMSRMPQMAEERSLFPRRNHRQIPHKCQEKRSLPQTALPEIQQTPEKRGLFPRQHHRQIPHNRNPVAAGKYLFRRRCSHAWI